MLVAVFRDLRDLSGLNDLLNVLQSLLVSPRALSPPSPCGAKQEPQQSPYGASPTSQALF